MTKVVVFGNSGSGKSTLAKQLRDSCACAHLDLDTIAWQAVVPPQRKPLSQSRQLIDEFLARNQDWVIEGCYADLLHMVMADADEVIFLNLPIHACIENAKRRPWEPHKYPSKQAQDENLAMLIDWISAYTRRDDTFSHRAHQQLYDDFKGNKSIRVENQALKNS
ncbi:AAA family ATPase [Thalassotalea sp. Y01]|uniref:AAA family ATPase n=1 Tax=Thalassotalea sp. Y01 TaxID=2729613 RepID=UPI00145F72BE|nr:AAA family ATPase [Thalassotalea sp. Y01]NMP17295.1 dephospho-CoA kinase [Thalassotalea sp. Y01]